MGLAMTATPERAQHAGEGGVGSAGTCTAWSGKERGRQLGGVVTPVPRATTY